MRELLSGSWRAGLMLGLVGCAPASSRLSVGDFDVEIDRASGEIRVRHFSGVVLERVRMLVGDGTASDEMQLGSFRFEETDRRVVEGVALGRERVGVVDVLGPDGERLGLLSVQYVRDDVLALSLSHSAPPDAEGDARVGFSAACPAEGPFYGAGLHQLDVDHRGEAFALWVSEPGVGKVEGDQTPEDWFLRGTRHASSYPVPWLLLPTERLGLLLDAESRVELDLCASDAERFSMVSWEPTVNLLVVAGGTAVAPIETMVSLTGLPELASPWVFSPWNDAIQGSERVREVAATLRAAGAPSSAIWTEDWKGGEDKGLGYRLSDRWEVDRTLYPDAELLAAELEAGGFKWLAYFAPTVKEGTETYGQAEADGVIVQDVAGEPYLFTGVTFEPTALIDVSGPAGQAWAQARMDAALEVGFDGWMADFGEWLPTDARTASGLAPLAAHQRYPGWWAETNAEAIAGRDATFFSRSGWLGTGGVQPVVWGGDQRTSFDTDDGFPTVVAMGLGAGNSGIPVFSHDVAGYNSVGNPPATEELFLRWAALGAYPPVMRNHHGAFAEENHQFDSTPESLAAWAALSREHMRLWPYRYGLAAQAAETGRPMLLHPALLFGADTPADWGRMDAWMLGGALYVAPVTVQGATGREVDLPDAVRWLRWPELELAQDGRVDVPLGEIAVFMAEHSVIPTFTVVPDTLVEGAEGLVGLDQADAGRTLYVFGSGGSFTEADGTRYVVSGTLSAAAEAELELQAGQIAVGELTVTVTGAPRKRLVRVVAVP